MTQEDKELLLKDLCARLPYGVICFASDYEYGDIGKLWCVEPFEDLDPPITIQYPKGNTITKFCSEIKPYLRPMSSMTDEERLELLEVIVGKDAIKYFQVLPDGSIDNTDAAHQDLQNFTMHWINFDGINTASYLDYLNAHHFDYRGLILKGLALEAPEGMYNVNEK